MVSIRVVLHQYIKHSFPNISFFSWLLSVDQTSTHYRHGIELTMWAIITWSRFTEKQIKYSVWLHDQVASPSKHNHIDLHLLPASTPRNQRKWTSKEPPHNTIHINNKIQTYLVNVIIGVSIIHCNHIDRIISIVSLFRSYRILSIVSFWFRTAYQSLLTANANCEKGWKELSFLSPRHGPYIHTYIDTYVCTYFHTQSVHP